MRLLVTGGAGFIGSNLVRFLLGQPGVDRVVVLDALTYAGNLASLADVRDDPRFVFVHGDVRDADVVARLVGEADAVVHLAAETHVDRSIDAPSVFLETNVVGAGVVLDACRRAGARLLAVSTDEVYGSVDAPQVCAEDAPLAPNSPYAASKAAADLLARSYRETYGFPVLVARPSNTYGPFQLPEKLIPLAVTNLLDGEPVPVFGDGQQVRSWTFVTDTCAGLWTVLTRGTPGEVYNVGAGDERRNLAVVQRLAAELGAGPGAVVHVEDRPGHDRRYAIDAGRLRALGWRPTTTLDDGLATTVRWYREHEGWWRPLEAAGLTRRRGTGET